MGLSADQQQSDHLKRRSRSNTATSAKSRKRPQSRASTTSVHSAGTHPMNDAHIGIDHHHPQIDGRTDLASQLRDYQNAHHRDPNNHFHHRDPHSFHHRDVVHDGRFMRHSMGPYEAPGMIDPALGAAVNHMVYSQDDSHMRQSVPADHFGHSFAEDDSQLLEGRSEDQDDVDSVAGVGGQAKKPSKSSAANELEMRNLFNANKNRSLPEVASELHGNERGPQSERARQVFAMLWISQVCDHGKGSVPRGRVYAAYVNRCGSERVTVLNPASFGKLVRVLFPGLKTRRLGVRGESKYHYVNFSLKETEPEAAIIQNPAPPVQNAGEASRGDRANNVPTHAPADRAVFPSPNPPRLNRRDSRRSRGYIKPHSVYSQPVVLSTLELDSATSKMDQKLRFPPPDEVAASQYDPITLPKIDPYIPQGTDVDSASALSALYRSHCTSLVECIRFCKEKNFFHLFTSFHGTLTMPVQRLFANPSVAPWIEECDFVMYQAIIRVVAPLTLQVAPKTVLDALRNISDRLVHHIQDSFHHQPTHVIDAKVAPATLFAGLLDRELRVNLTAHAAANMLSNPANRDQMYEDWITQVNIRKVAECLPTRGMDDFVKLLVTSLRGLLDPMQVSWDIEGRTIYGEMAMKTGRHQQDGDIHADSTTENVLDRWVNFLTSLPAHFPYASHAEIVWGVQSVGTAVMRDITIQQGKSFGAWWVTKCWIDEMIAFMAEQGGFMEYKSTRDVDEMLFPGGGASQQATRYSTRSIDSPVNSPAHGANSSNGPRPMDLTSQNAINAAAGQEDSGIYMPRSDDESTMPKYGNFPDHQASMHYGHTNGMMGRSSGA